MSDSTGKISLIDSHPDSSPGSSALGLGCWSFGDQYWKTDYQSHTNTSPSPIQKYKKIIEAAIKSGITHFDTAQGYGHGISEQILGQTLNTQASGLSIATKTFLRPPETMMKGVEKSLRRMQTDCIDIFYLHWPKPGRDLRPHIEALEKIRERGLIRSIGVSNFSPSQIRPLLDAGKIDYCQFGYSLLWRTPEVSLVPFCREHEIRMVSYSSLAQGLLAHEPGWIDTLSPSDPRFNLLPAASEKRPLVQKICELLAAESTAAGIPLAQLALAWNLSRGFFRYVLFGARSEKQLNECAASVTLDIPADILARLEKITDPLVHQWKEGDNIFGHRP